MRDDGPVAFVLGGGGLLGATQVGMLRALAEAGITPDVVVGTSVGALNGAFVAADPTLAGVQRLGRVWTELTASEVFSGSLLTRLGTLARHGTHLHSGEPLRRLVETHLPARVEELAVPFQCVAACIETAAAHWFSAGPLAEAVLASAAVPGLLPPVRIGDRHYIDGGIVRSVPVGRAVHLGAGSVYVLHVGRIERPLTAPRWPWEVGMVAFEVARRNRFTEDMADLPEGVRVHVLPSGQSATPLVAVRYRRPSRVADRIESAYGAASAYLAAAAGRAR